jgi:exodeoxyribonuclease III
MPLSLLTLNVGAPSLDRAERQLRWLADRPEQVFVLTETKATEGSRLLASAFAAAGYAVTFPAHEPGELGVMIVSRVATTIDPIGTALDYLPARAAGIVVETRSGPIRILGAYVPSRDQTFDKTERKRTWLTRFRSALTVTASHVPIVLLGDLNVLEPGHSPAHAGQFAPFEYDFYTDLSQQHSLLDVFRHLHADRIEHSWARRPELGYRYDHAHASKDAADLVTSCEYVHATRDVALDGTRLTDHSGLAVELSLECSAPLLVSDPTAAAAADDDQEPTLF